MLEDGFESNYMAVVLPCRPICEKVAKNTVMAVIPSSGNVTGGFGTVETKVFAIALNLQHVSKHNISTSQVLHYNVHAHRP